MAKNLFSSFDGQSLGYILVPCTVNMMTGKFDPVYTTTSYPWPKVSEQAMSLRHQEWSEEEDRRLLELVEECGAKYWSYIASILNQDCHHNSQIRKGRTCRERWINHINPYLNKGEWTQEEDLKLFLEQKNAGNKWSKIAKILIGRTENSVKNRYHSLINKTKKEFHLHQTDEQDVCNFIIEKLDKKNIII